MFKYTVHLALINVLQIIVFRYNIHQTKSCHWLWWIYTLSLLCHKRLSKPQEATFVNTALSNIVIPGIYGRLKEICMAWNDSWFVFAY